MALLYIGRMKKMDYKQIYEKIMGIDRNIGLITICDRDGKIMYSGHREGVKIF